MKRSYLRSSVAASGLAVAGLVILASVLSARDFRPGRHRPTDISSDSLDVIAAVARYQSALRTGDSSAALSMLARDVIVLESGDVESFVEYRAHRLAADMSFAQAIPSTRANVRAVVRGDVAWVSSTTQTRGEFRGRQINSSGAELMVLSREPDGWKIRAIHWSSKRT